MKIIPYIIMPLCLIKWVYYITKNKIRKYFACSIISAVLYWSILYAVVCFEGKVPMMLFGGMSVVFYFVSLIVSFIRGSHFLNVMEKYYPHVMHEYNRSTRLGRSKAFDKKLEQIQEECIPVVKDAILQRNLIVPMAALHLEIIVITAACLWDGRLY